MATMSTPMTLLSPDDDFQPVPLGGYLRAIPSDELAGHDFSNPDVDKVYREPGGRFVHVVLSSKTPNVFLVIVIDEPAQHVHGHHILDLNRHYGLE